MYPPNFTLIGQKLLNKYKHKTKYLEAESKYTWTYI